MEIGKNEIKIGGYAVSIMARDLYGKNSNLIGAYPTIDTYRFLLDIACDLIDAAMYSKSEGYNATAETQNEKCNDIRKALNEMLEKYTELKER